MAFLTLDDLEAGARQKSAEIISLMRTRHAEGFQAAILYGALKGRKPKPGEPIEFYLLLLDRRPPAVFNDHAGMLADAGAVPFGSPGTFLVPGILQVQVSHRLDFEKAAKAVHPQIATMVANYEVLFTVTTEIRRALTTLFTQATRRMKAQRTA